MQRIVLFAKNNSISLLLLVLVGGWIGYQRVEVWLATKELIGRPAPQFVLQQVDGTLADFQRVTKGQKALLVFWATWCGVCRSEIDTLREAEEKFSGKGFRLISVVLPHNENQKDIQDFIKEKNINYAVWIGDGRASDAYGVRALPTTVWIDETGTIKDLTVGRSFGLIGKLKDWIDNEAALR